MLRLFLAKGKLRDHATLGPTSSSIPHTKSGTFLPLYPNYIYLKLTVNLKAAYSDVDRRLKKSEDRFELLKSHAESKLQEANETIATMQRRNESELARMHAMIRQVFTDFPAYSDTGYSDTPLAVTVLTCPKWPTICI